MLAGPPDRLQSISAWPAAEKAVIPQAWHTAMPRPIDGTNYFLTSPGMAICTRKIRQNATKAMLRSRPPPRDRKAQCNFISNKQLNSRIGTDQNNPKPTDGSQKTKSITPLLDETIRLARILLPGSCPCRRRSGPHLGPDRFGARRIPPEQAGRHH